MRRSSWVIVTTLVAGLAAAQSTGPLTTNEPTLDFGRVAQGQILERSVEISNASDAPVTVAGVIFHCQCASGRLDRKTIAPRTSARLDLQFATAGLEGPVRKGVELQYVAGRERSLLIDVCVDVVPKWTVTPTELNLGGVRAGQAFEKQLVIEVVPDATIQFSSKTAAEWIELRSADVSGRRYSVVLKVPVDRRPGALESTIEISSDDPQKPSMSIPVIARIEGDLVVRPRTVHFGRVRKGESATAEVVLESRSDHAFRITQIRTEEFLTIEPSERNATTRHVLKIVAAKNMPSRNYTGQVILITDHPEEREIVLKVQGRFGAED